MPGLPSSEESVTATISYAKRPSEGEPLETYLCELPEGKTRANNVDPKDVETTITDLRTVSKEFTLAQNGFRLAQLNVPDDINWQDGAEVKRLYYPRLEELLLKETGATRVHIFDHTLRNGTAKESKYVLLVNFWERFKRQRRAAYKQQHKPRTAGAEEAETRNFYFNGLQLTISCLNKNKKQPTKAADTRHLHHVCPALKISDTARLN
ncbi:hypothetical protein WJX74_001764 [Apatococcus lobatus]|uniref:Uncharacterized protein n=1 Tax=Apatococcus lobatus TaxID=904363 RepID=A0AAW1RFR3_9CHLO